MENKTFLSGISDFFGSVLDKAPGVITAINSGKNNNANNQLDAYGRLPGQPGYGTTTAPAGFQTSTLPKWVIPSAIGAGILVVLVVVVRLFKK